MATENAREYKSLITETGKAKIIAAVQGGHVVNITQAAVGDGGGAYYVPTADMRELQNEVWRGSIAGKQSSEDSPNMVDIKMVVPADVGGFTVREAALLDDEGDMIAVCNLPDTEKVVITSGSAGTLTIVMHIILTDTDAVEFTVDPFLDPMYRPDVEQAIREALEVHDAQPIILTEGVHYGAELPEPGTPGRLFLLKV